jgi:N6-adenosine-specific RNA methylase IME4
MKFDCIVLDPPWSFKVWSPKGNSRSAENHYKCMTFDDIKNMNVGDLAKENCTLFL